MAFIATINILLLMGSSVLVYAQTPTITVQFSNPQNNCGTEEYCLDVEFRANMPDQEIFGMNIRFFYDDDVLELIDFRDFQGGYGAVEPDPPIISTSGPAGPALFNFTGAAEFINGAVQLINAGDPPILLDTSNWTKVFQICFFVDDPNANLDTFCPSVVWDLEQNPENGGFLAGDDGVVITIVDPDPDNESYPAFENVLQFNWEYTGNGTPPYGEPVDSVCSNINCTLPLTFLSFTGKELENGNLLEWQTIDEINVAGFDLQRSNDRISWKNLGFINSTGAGTDPAYYQFLDSDPSWNTNYYRLRQSDTDGKFSYSSIVSIHSIKDPKNNELIVYPNPISEGRITIVLTTVLANNSIIRFYNPMGQIVREEVFADGHHEMDIHDLPAGIYILHLSPGDLDIYKKLIIY